MDIANLVIRVTNDGLTAAQRELRRLRDEADGTQSSTSKLGENLKRLAKYGAVSLGGLAVAAVKVSGDFEESMNAVIAVSGATGKDFDDLRSLAKKMGSETAFSATEAANGMEYLAMAGMNTQQVLATIPNALSLAAAGSIDLAQSADILSNVMSGMGIAAEDSAMVADVLAATAAGANTDISALGEAMKYVAPVAKTMGHSLEEVSASIGILGNAGIAAGQAGTSLRSIMSRIAADKGAKSTLDGLGVSATDSSGKMRSLTDILSDLQVATADLSSEQQIEIFKKIAGTEGMGALAVLVDGVANDSLPQLIEKLKESEGAAKKMAAIRMEGLNGAIKGAKSAAEGFLIALGDAGLLDLAASGVTALADGIRGLSEWLPQAAAQVQAFFESAEVATAVDMAIEGLTAAWDNLVSVIQATADVIAPVIDFFREHEELSKSLATAIGIVASAFAIYNAAVAIGAAVTSAFTGVLLLVTSPIFLIVAAMVALTAAGVYVYRNWDEIKAKAVEIWGAIKTYISDKIAETKQAIVDKWEQIKSDAVTYLNILKIVMSNKFQEIKYKTSQKFTEIKESIITTLKELPAKLLQVGKDIVQGLINGIKSGVSGVTTAISDMASGAVTKAKDVLGIKSPSRVMMGVGSDFSQGFINGIKGKSDEVRKTAIQQAQSAIDGVKGSIATLQKEIALFGNDSPLASFEYDVSIGKYKDVNAELIEQQRQRIIQMQRLVDLDKQQTEQIKLQKAANASIYSSIESMNRQLYEMGGERSPLEMLVWDLENTSKHANASAEAIDNLKDKTKELFEQQQAQDSAKRANEAAAGLAGVKGDLLGLNDNPVQRIVDDYEHRLAAIAEYEQTHQKILQESADKQIEIERLKNMALQDMALASGEIIAGDMASIFKDMLGEQSKGYRAMFAIEKGFAIAQGAIAIQRNISAAMATGFPQNIPLIAGAIAQGASLMSNIKGITAGFKQGGYTGNMGASQVAGVVHGQEYVFDAQSTKRIGVDNLNAMRRGDSPKGGGDVNISVNVDAKGNSSVQGDNERMGRDMANGIKAVVMDVMRKEKRQGGMLYA